MISITLNNPTDEREEYVASMIANYLKKANVIQHGKVKVKFKHGTYNLSF
jgi:hypothetical protein